MTREVMQQLKKIDKEIRKLQGKDVDFRLARKLTYVIREIAEYFDPVLIARQKR